MTGSIISFKKIQFYNYSPKYVLNKIMRGGYLVAPAASSISTVYKNSHYWISLQNSSMAILDSGLLCLLLKLIGIKKITKLSGYLLLTEFIKTKKFKKKKLLLINPNLKHTNINELYLKRKQFERIFSYNAPKYTKSLLLNDIKLLKLVNDINPDVILINIGGEKQEILAHSIYKKIKNKKISILCLGAAISFLTGLQARITKNIDKYYLGWLFRFISEPRIFGKRVLSSLYLFIIFFKK